MFNKIIKQILEKEIGQLNIDYQAAAFRWVDNVLEQDEFQERIDKYLQFQLEKYVCENNEMLYKKINLLYDDLIKEKEKRAKFNIDSNSIWDKIIELRHEIDLINKSKKLTN